MIHKQSAKDPSLPRTLKQTAISFDENELRLQVIQGRSKTIYSIAWRDITRISAFKEDLITTDQIRLEISDETDSICITEDDVGYKELLAALPIKLLGFPAPEVWWKEVAQPPMRRNYTVLFER